MAKKKKSNPQARPTKVPKEKVNVQRPAYFIPFGSFSSAQKWGILLCVVVALIIYAQSINFGYVLDDQIVITKNDYTKQGFEGIWEILSSESFEGYFGEQKDLVAGARYRPLSIVSFAIEYALFGFNPHISHAINVLLYSLTLILLYYLISLMWPRFTNDKWWLNLACWGTLLYAVHPLHTEVIANIKGRDEIMAFMFGLSSLIMLFYYLNKKSSIWCLLMMACLLLSIFSKENGITFCLFIPVAAWLFHRDKLPSKKRWLIGLTVVLVAIGYLLIRQQVIGYFLSSGVEIKELMNNPFVGMTTEEKYGTIFYTLGKYLVLLVWPYPLSHDYYPYAIPVTSLFSPQALISFLIYLGLAIWAIVGLFKRKKTSFLPIFYLGALFMVSNIVVPVGTFMNERFLYFSSMSYAIGLPLYLMYLAKTKYADNPRTFTLVKTLFVVYVIVLTAISVWRVPAWKDAFSLNKAAVEAYPNSARSNLFMGTALFRQAEEISDPTEKLDKLRQAQTYIRKSCAIYPNYGNALKMKAGVAAQIYGIDQNMDEMLQQFREVILIRPNLSYVHEYLKYLNRTNSGNLQLARFYYDIGYNELFKKQGRLDWALEFLNYGLEIQPNNDKIQRAIQEIRSTG